jgi:hypothetical protein
MAPRRVGTASANINRDWSRRGVWAELFARVGPKLKGRRRFLDDKSIMFLAEVLKAPVQDLFPPRAAVYKRLSDFMAQLETTRF